MTKIYDPNLGTGKMLLEALARIETSGKLMYDPPRKDFKKTNKTRTLIVQLARDELDLYYQWFIRKQFGECMALQRPMFGTHVTIVGGAEHVPNMKAWKKHEGEIVNFQYGPAVRNHWHFWSLPVYSEYFQELRAELGMKREPDFHITIGRQYDWQPVAVRARRKAWQIRLEEEGVLA